MRSTPGCLNAPRLQIWPSDTHGLCAWGKGLDDIVPRRKALSTNGICAPTTSTIYGNASIMARPLSSTRPPPFETMMPSTNEAMSSAVVVGGRRHQRGRLR